MKQIKYQKRFYSWVFLIHIICVAILGIILWIMILPKSFIGIIAFIVFIIVGTVILFRITKTLTNSYYITYLRGLSFNQSIKSISEKHKIAIVAVFLEFIDRNKGYKNATSNRFLWYLKYKLNFDIPEI